VRPPLCLQRRDVDTFADALASVVAEI